MAAAALNDRVDNGATPTRVRVADKEPPALADRGRVLRADPRVHPLQVDLSEFLLCHRKKIRFLLTTIDYNCNLHTLAEITNAPYEEENSQNFRSRMAGHEGCLG